MGIPHHAFNCKFIIFYITIACSVFFVTKNVNAYDSLFIVKNIKVDVTAANSVKAQDQAFEQAQAKAFMVLAKRMVEESQVQNMQTPDSLTISSLIKDYEITNDSLSAVRYIGTYIFRFREAAVSKFFSVSGVKFTDKSGKPLLVLPVFQKNGKNILWSDGNLWMQAWSQNNMPRGILPIEVPIGDLSDISDIDENQALRYERKSLDRMLMRYNSKEAAIIIAVPDNVLSNIKSDNMRAIGNLRISIYRTDKMRAQHVQDIILDANGHETLAQLYARGVAKSHSILQRDWKSKTVSSALQSQIFAVHVNFESIKQWVKVEQALSNTSGLNNLLVTSIKKNGAKLLFKFRGDEDLLRSALLRSKLLLGQGYKNRAANPFINNNRDNPDIIYDLIYSNKHGDAPMSRFYQNIEPATGSSYNFRTRTF